MSLASGHSEGLKKWCKLHLLKSASHLRASRHEPFYLLTLTFSFSQLFLIK